eukprot:scaffold2831_cov249-Ochromonas_danica.AAC.28
MATAVKPSKGKKSLPTERDNASMDVRFQKWINQQMEKRVLEYSDLRKIKICCGTWNVNTRQLGASSDLKPWLLDHLTMQADIYAISLQEIVDLNVMNVVVNSKSSDESTLYWMKEISSAIAETGESYRLIFERHMVGLLLLIYVKDPHRAHIQDVRSSVIYTGGYGVTGNKGGIAVRMDFYDSSLCFVGAHFHANRDNVITRNLDWQTIVDTAVFLPINGKPNAPPSVPVDRRRYSVSHKQHKAELTYSIPQHEYIFWFGDLNYRIATEVEDEDVFSAVQTGDWPGLRAKDQLNIERELGNVFLRYEEGIINFAPTYKYQPGTDNYERRPEKKLRAPAWCDRILWCNNSKIKEDVALLQYSSVVEPNVSDHKPVVAWFECNLKCFVPDRVRDVYQELLFAVDKWINASTPKISVENRIIDFGTVAVNQKYYNTLSLRNTGTVMAEWAFVPKNDELCVSRPWVKFIPEDAEIAMNVLNEKELKTGLEDIAILHLTNGSDFFVVINGKLDIIHKDQMRKIFVTDNPLSRKSGGHTTATAPAEGTADSTGTELQSRTSGRYPRTDVHTSTIPSHTALEKSTSADSDEDEEDNREILYDDVYK